MEHGKYTAMLGRKLDERIRASGRGELKVFFDHGTKGESKRTVPYFSEYGTSTTLAFVDIAIVNEKSMEVLVLCEIEEEGANPKKVIGDCFNIFLSDYVCIGGKRYDPRGAHFLLGIRVNERGNAKEKLSELEKRIPAAIRNDALKGIKLRFICGTDTKVLLGRLEKRILGILEV